ncbi:hypothetical protein DL766_008470 [Monosporascus sp. MC13-8B]|uniref:Uncharacterized protein n=1 Tax=Monosporascus cannonballus TaxID=155416 RepID=A0ABY0GXH9_9PEZI|nr:hypothetical protein DL762_008343 [Monosporascus cannonballus]RYO95847.1 hypothetical protein DL763_003481 [Monosporascus cannonballus]RYP19299.1 hypothetical protein DL766_008470 [Monosporascus sp. MC13-8B]
MRITWLYTSEAGVCYELLYRRSSRLGRPWWVPKNDQEQLEALQAIQKLVKGIDAHDFSQRHTEQIKELRRLANVVRDLNAQQPKQVEEIRKLTDVVKNDLDALEPNLEQLAQNHQEQLKFLGTVEKLVKSISTQDFAQRYAEQIEELRKLANVVKTDLDTHKPNQERLTQNHQEQLAALSAVEELVKGISARGFAQRHDEQVESLIEIKSRLEEISAQQPDKEGMMQKHEEQIRMLENLKDEFNTQLEKLESAMEKFVQEQQDKEYLKRKHRELLVALEKKQKVELTSQLADIRQLLDKIGNRQHSIQSAIPEQLPKLRDENAQSNTLNAESVELLSKLQEEKAGVQQQLQYVRNRLDQTTRDLEEAKSPAQDAKSENEEAQRKIRDMESLLEQRTKSLDNAQSRTTEADSTKESLEASLATWMREMICEIN